jgi:predicted nucleic acid-binding Zn ribbon protein
MERVQEILKRLLEGHVLGPATAGMRLMDLWAPAVGPEIARRTRAVSYRDACLVVEVTSSVWMNQLTYLKAEILSRLNQAAGPGAVSEIQFVMAGRSEPGERGSAPGAPGRGARSERVQGEDPSGPSRHDNRRGNE